MGKDLKFFDFSDGKEISEYRKKQMLDAVLEALKNGKTHYHSQTGNYCVVGLVYETEVIVIITENYKCARLRLCELPLIV